MTLRRVVALGTLLVPRLAAGFAHDSVIDEVVTAVGGDTTRQYVEIRMLGPSENFVSLGTVLGAFDATGAYAGDLVVPSTNVGGGTNRRWLAATAAFASGSGLAADFTFAAGVLPVESGMVCFGPLSMRTNPANAFDCVSYGAYCGVSPPGTPVGFTPENHALQRTGDAMDANAAFSCTPSLTPQNNANASAPATGDACAPGPTCGAPVTTTTLAPGGTTTTTLPLVAGGGPAATDCFGAWRVLGAVRTPTVRCTRRNAACDRGTGPECVFRAQLCFGDAAAASTRTRCRPGGVTRFALRRVSSNAVDRANAESVLAAVAALGGTRAGDAVSFPAPLASPACTAGFHLTVPPRGRRPGMRTLRARTAAGRTDADTLKLVCVP